MYFPKQLFRKALRGCARAGKTTGGILLIGFADQLGVLPLAKLHTFTSMELTHGVWA